MGNPLIWPGCIVRTVARPTLTQSKQTKQQPLHPPAKANMSCLQISYRCKTSLLHAHGSLPPFKAHLANYLKKNNNTKLVTSGTTGILQVHPPPALVLSAQTKRRLCSKGGIPATFFGRLFCQIPAQTSKCTHTFPLPAAPGERGSPSRSAPGPGTCSVWVGLVVLPVLPAVLEE